jgi:hypothetical protein
VPDLSQCPGCQSETSGPVDDGGCNPSDPTCVVLITTPPQPQLAAQGPVAPNNPQQPQQPKPEPKPGWCTALNHAGNTTVALGGATFLWGTLADAGVVTAPAGVALQASGGIGMAVGGIGIGIADTGLALGICH